MAIRPLQYTEIERARIQQQLKALADAVAAGGGGGGGPAAWGSITGTLSSQTDLQTALNGKANSTHGHSIADVTGLQGALDGKQATVPGGTVTVTVPNKSLEWVETVAALGVVPGAAVLLSIAPHSDIDENDAEMLDVMAMSATAGTDALTVTLAFAAPTAGPIKLNWRA